jgi:phage terminase small subunit
MNPPRQEIPLRLRQAYAAGQEAWHWSISNQPPDHLDRTAAKWWRLGYDHEETLHQVVPA